MAPRPSLTLAVVTFAACAPAVDIDDLPQAPRDAGTAARPRDAGPPSTSAPSPSTEPLVIERAAASAGGCMTGQYYVGRVRGMVLDYSNRPVVNALLSICGSACIPGTTGRDGRFEVTVDSCFTGSSEYAHGVAFVLDGQNQIPDVFYDINPRNETRMGVVRIERPVYVGTYAGGGYARAPRTISSAMVMVDGLGFSLTVVPENVVYPISATEEAVRVVRVPVATLPPYAGRAPAVAYAISPSDCELQTPAPVEFPNVSNLAPGTTVEVVAVGNHASLGRPAVGVLERVDTARVSSDGRRVVASTGLRFFGTVGYRTVSP